VNAWENAALAASLSLAAAGTAAAQTYQPCALDWNASRQMAEEAMERDASSHRVEQSYMFVLREREILRCPPDRVTLGRVSATPGLARDCGTKVCGGGD
jgi:hypothetical protein